MSRWLAKVFSQQSEIAVQRSDTSEQKVPVLLMEFRGLRYVSGFEFLSEVIENEVVTPYPEKNPVHVGIINMRGSIVPVLCLDSFLGQACEATNRPKSERMVVFSTPMGSFAIGVDSVRKHLVAQAEMTIHENIEIDGKIYRVLDEQFFRNLNEWAA